MDTIENTIAVFETFLADPTTYGFTNDDILAIEQGLIELKALNHRKKLGEKVDLIKNGVSIFKILEEIFRNLPWP